MLLDKVALVLALKVNTPIDRILELDAILHSLFENLDTLCVFKPYELGVHNALKP